MEWANDLLEPLLRCDVASGPRLIVILLGAVASTVTITVAGHALFRRIVGLPGPVKRAANALRDEGKSRAQQDDLERALELYDLSVLMNPGAADVYYLRGLIKEERGELNRAIADWERCLKRHGAHLAARGKLSHYKRTPSPLISRWRIATALPHWQPLWRSSASGAASASGRPRRTAR